jgi:hypothetical protein
MAMFGSSWKDDNEDTNMFSHWKDDDDYGPEPNESLKSAKKKYNRHTQPKVSDWDETLMDGIEYESWDELYDDYVGESDLHEFVQWLKDNFQVPNKLGSQNP